MRAFVIGVLEERLGHFTHPPLACPGDGLVSTPARRCGGSALRTHFCRDDGVGRPGASSPNTATADATERENPGLRHLLRKPGSRSKVIWCGHPDFCKKVMTAARAVCSWKSSRACEDLAIEVPRSTRIAVLDHMLALALRAVFWGDGADILLHPSGSLPTVCEARRAGVALWSAGPGSPWHAGACRSFYWSGAVARVPLATRGRGEGRRARPEAPAPASSSQGETVASRQSAG